MVGFSEILNYYSRKDVQKSLIEMARNREVVGVYGNGSFDKRPNVIAFGDDIIQMVKKGVVAFHCSLERWSNPMKLETSLTLSQLNELRIGWDLVIDPDCPSFELSKIAVKQIVQMLEDSGLSCYRVKFTGGKGFHIGIPFEAFPKKVNNRPINELYPELPRSIIEYIKYRIKDDLAAEILDSYSLKEVAEFVGKEQEGLLTNERFDPFKAINIDAGLISSRHLFRMPFSLHEKNHLISLPIEDVERFKREDAAIDKFKGCSVEFFQDVKRMEAASLVIDSLDFAKKSEPTPRVERVERRQKRYFRKEEFPPCIKKLLQGGMADGRKRGLFILITFLRSAGWSWDEVEAEVNEWNKKNKPLPTRYIISQLKWFKQQNKDLLPPNCEQQVYKDLGIYCGDEFHKDIKNPINYPYKKK
jgi:DNA primase catalytic subunit